MTQNSHAPRSVLKPPSDFNPNTEAPLDFPDREWGSMTADDYRAIGFMAHQ